MISLGFSRGENLNFISYEFCFYGKVSARGDHIVPYFEEIWPSKPKTQRVKRGIEYYLDVREADRIYCTTLFRPLRTTGSRAT